MTDVILSISGLSGGLDLTICLCGKLFEDSLRLSRAFQSIVVQCRSSSTIA